MPAFIAHQVAVAFLDNIAEMNADAKLDTALGRQTSVALDHSVLHFDSAAHGIDDAPKLNKNAVSRPLNYAAMM
jgi:hypothetical protein